MELSALKMLTHPCSELLVPVKDRLWFSSIVTAGWLEVTWSTQLASSTERGTAENVQRKKTGMKEQ
jgi:hypothetical protein